jgi:hypothetical protein
VGALLIDAITEYHCRFGIEPKEIRLSPIFWAALLRDARFYAFWCPDNHGDIPRATANLFMGIPVSPDPDLVATPIWLAPTPER